jgi:chorismate dehydratase
VHALLVAGEPPASVEIVSGTPAQLNVALASGAIDVAPASSIEYARHSDTYRLLPDFVIASDGPVGSILFESTRSIEDLADRSIALPTASATSVVLLKILLHFKYRIGARFHWFDQDSGTDPLEGGSDAALWIGDVALRRATPAGHHVYDLGAEWKEWTGLPFVFAAWQTAAPCSRDAELRTLVALLHESRAYFHRNARRLAESWSQHFSLAPAPLLAYWQSLKYSFDEPMQRGLLEYYRWAARLGEAPALEHLGWLER